MISTPYSNSGTFSRNMLRIVTAKSCPSASTMFDVIRRLYQHRTTILFVSIQETLELQILKLIPYEENV